MIPTTPPAALALALALSACQAMAPTVAAGPAADACGAADWQSLVGRDVSPVLAATFANPIRIIRPDDMVTMDFQPGRINFRLNADDTVASVDCG